MTAPPVQLLATYDDEGLPSVEIHPEDISVTSLQALRDALPELATLQSYGPTTALQLASAILHLAPGTQGELFYSEKALEGMLPVAYNASSLSDIERWHREGTPRVPGPEDLVAPHWQGDTLVFVSLDLHYSLGSPLFISARYEADLADSAWPVARESLATPAPASERTDELLKKTFGSTPGAVVRVRSEDQATYLFVALDAAPESARFVVRGVDAPDSTSQRFDAWRDLIKAHPELATPATLSSLATALFNAIAERHVRDGHYHVIADADAYREEYRTKGWSSYRLRYHVDQIAETRFQVANMASITEPTVADERLRTYFIGPRNQPFVWEVDLNSLSTERSPELTEMATSELISDSGGYFGRPRDPKPAVRSDDTRILPED
ncbi:hypothetical protein FRC96_08005 [Lujinxingia vulgaris]|uniref:Uncharacterized protein n=1 Tax=Lujinxingia vulgaris TaxID=2600176 RepID=A0A5C6XF35_9DELT|nr:hypothetical protein [Lujinxingia vulgaris]TXD37977.1 hypothetical protein FRC96_08005 [Lujinxingia vulgaris]